MTPDAPFPPPTGRQYTLGATDEWQAADTPKRRGLSPTALVLILVLGAGTVLTFGIQSLEANEDRRTAPPQIVSDVPLRPPGATTSDDPAGYSFAWGGSGLGANGTVSANGDYLLKSEDGVERRYIDGTTYSTRDPMESWTTTNGDTISYIGRLGFRSTIDLDDILTEHVRAISTIDIEAAVDGRTEYSVRIDVMSPDADPDQISGWLVAVGMPNTRTATTASGAIHVDLAVTADGSTVDSMSVDNGIHRSSYELVEVFTTPPPIALPDDVVDD